MSTLIITNNTNKALRFIKKTIEGKENRSINIFNNIDILCYNNKDINLSTELIREINRKLTDRSSDLSNKYLIISNFNRSTPEAQNAFLKTLEESNKEIFLVSKNKSGILETIISRVFIKNISAKYTYSKEIQEILYKIIFNCELNLIKDLSSKYKLEKILNNFEYFLNKNREKIEIGKRTLALNKIYLFKKRNVEIKLNNEIQLTYMFVGLL